MSMWLIVGLQGWSSVGVWLLDANSLIMNWAEFPDYKFLSDTPFHITHSCLLHISYGYEEDNTEFMRNLLSFVQNTKSSGQ